MVQASPGAFASDVNITISPSILYLLRMMELKIPRAGSILAAAAAAAGSAAAAATTSGASAAAAAGAGAAAATAVSAGHSSSTAAAAGASAAAASAAGASSAGALLGLTIEYCVLLTQHSEAGLGKLQQMFHACLF